MMVRKWLLDAWTALSHKEAMEAGSPTGAGVYTWVGDHQRRLTAYKILRAYMENAARHFLPNIVTDDDRSKRREYGDAALIVGVIMGALLGDDQSIAVDGADADPPDGTPEGFVSKEMERQQWLANWADNARLRMKMIESERNAVGQGDGVYLVAWNAAKRKVVIRTFDPGFYFPVLDSRASEDDYPDTVHIAWEEETEPGKARIRRITWQLRERSDGAVRYPYQEPGEPLSTLACYMTEATWELGDFRTVEDLTTAGAVFETDGEGEIRDRDLGIDYIPVVHLPNTVALADHYGHASLSTILQILDDLQAADTDLQATSALLGSPPLSLSGAASADTQIGYQPGTVFKVPEGGRLDMVDTSSCLDALLKYVEFLLKRLSTNSRLPESILGRASAADVASGVLMAMSFGPLQQMVEEMRLVRNEKYPLILKFVQRLAIVHGQLEAPVMPAAVLFGSYLPSDAAAVVSQVTSLLMAHAISTRTAVNMLVEAGLPIEDAAAEVERIQSENYAAAVQLLAALGSEQVVADYLHVKMPTAVPPEPITVTPPVGAGQA